MVLGGCQEVYPVSVTDGAEVSSTHARLILAPGGWYTKLDSLPPEVEFCIREHVTPIDHFDLRDSGPDVVMEWPVNRITDDRRKFEPGCTRRPGYANFLFVRAKAVREYWVIEYEYGGYVHGKAAFVVIRELNGDYHECDTSELKGARTAAVLVAALEGKKSAS